MSELVGLEYDINDPYGKTIDAYQACASDLEQLLAHGYARIAIWLTRTPDRARNV